MKINRDRNPDRSMSLLLFLFVLLIAGVSFVAPQQVDLVPGTPSPNPYTVVR